jgi:hypothetical protein
VLVYHFIQSSDQGNVLHDIALVSGLLVMVVCHLALISKQLLLVGRTPYQSVVRRA